MLISFNSRNEFGGQYLFLVGIYLLVNTHPTHVSVISKRLLPGGACWRVESETVGAAKVSCMPRLNPLGPAPK